MTFEQNTLPCSYFTEKKPLLLENGTSIDELTVAYESYGKLNKNKSNAIIVCHALAVPAWLSQRDCPGAAVPARLSRARSTEH